ncbi:MAG: DUF427 domain-containing protein [Myxococcota bacterium]
MDERDLAAARRQWRFRGTDRPSFAAEPAAGQESVWDYPRPPLIEPDGRLVRVQIGETTLAESQATVRVLETASPPVFYIPPADVDTDRLILEGGGSVCEWKGTASYWSVRGPESVAKGVGWSYESPFDAFESIRGYLSFYPARLACYVGEHRVLPQPGGFYGGWVTPEIVGPFKGEPGTGGW